MPVEIREPLSISHGALVATEAAWRVTFAFPGPDARYSYTVLELRALQVQTLLRDYERGFDRYELLKGTLPRGINATEQFGGFLTIRVGDFAEGVCLSSYQVPVRTRAELDRRLRELRSAIGRGDELVAAAKALKR